MIDANSQFFAILTNVGMAKQANADALGTPWKFTHMGVGDANETDPIPSATQTSLIREWRRRPLNQVRVDPVNPAVIIAEQVIPADEGGFWIREIGLYDADGDLVAVANCAPSFKPVLSQGSGRTQVVRMNFIVASAGNITLKIDPSVVLATREYVDTRIQEELYKLDSKQSVLVATTANIALAGLQVIDGVSVPAGARVLVKNQTVAKDNGIYLASAAVWARSADADSNAEVTSALLTSVEQGATQADTRWQLITDGLIVVGTTALTFQNVTQGFAPINSPALISPTANTAPQFNSSLLLVNSAFAKRMGVEFSGFSPLIASTVLGASSIGGIVAGASATPINITLPPTAGVPEGATVEVVNAGAGAVTVLAAGLDVLASQVAGVIPVVLGMGDNAKFVKVSGTWRLRGGSMALKYAAVMSGSNWITQPLFTSDKSVATTEYAMRASGNYRGFTNAVASATLTSAAVGTLVTTIGAFTLTMPAANAVPSGGAIHFRNIGTGVVTVACVGADWVNGGNGNLPTSILLQPGATLSLASNGVNAWWASGSAQLQFSKVLGYTPDRFDSTKLFATTEFVKQMGMEWGSFTTVSGSTVLGNGSVGGIVNVGSATPINLTFPPTAPIASGGMIEVANGAAGAVTLLGSNGELFTNLSGSAITIVLGQGESAILARLTGEWRLVGGSAALRYSASFAASLVGPTCYQKLPGGDIEQWGLYTGAASGADVVITLQVAMLAAPTNIELTFVDFNSSLAVGTSTSLQVRNSTLGTITVRNLNSAAASFFWRVRGRV